MSGDQREAPMSERAGWVALHRSIFDDAPRPFCEGFAWAYTFAFATYRDRPDYSPPLTRGQLATTAGKLATAWGWERQRVRDTLRRWERAGQISTQGAGRCTVLTVVNYDVHQSVEKVPQPRPNRAPTTPQPCPTTKKQENKRTKEQSYPDLDVPLRPRDAAACKPKTGLGPQQVDASRVTALGRAKAGGLYIEFGQNGSGHPQVEKALRRLKFRNDSGHRWECKPDPDLETDRRRLLHGMVPEAEALGLVRNEAEPAAERKHGPTLRAQAKWAETRDELRSQLGAEAVTNFFSTFWGSGFDGETLTIATADEMAAMMVRKNYAELVGHCSGAAVVVEFAPDGARREAAE